MVRQLCIYESRDEPQCWMCHLFQDSVRIIEQKDIDDKGHGHLVVVDGLETGITIIGNIYAPVKSQGAMQEAYYERLANLIEELELRYLLNEPNLILLGDFNLPLELDIKWYTC
jgi:hypothetical protein